jgi:choline monooxygenase
MFISETHLPQLLPPEAYYDRGWYDRELAAVLRPSWWAVAVLDELRNEGDFVTFDHVDGPVILRRSGGAIRGYRNVCAHRLAKLTGKASGHCESLRCEYHGWEYEDTGVTRKIPDAPSFRPLEKGRLGLDVLRVETVGGIVFLSFDSGAPPVRDWLGEEASRIEAHFDHRTHMLWKADVDVPVNWKLLVENNLESYHVGTVHAATLGGFPEERACEHELRGHGSRFTTPGARSVLSRFRLAVAERIGRRTSGRYSHAIVHPAFMWIDVGLLSGFQSVVPTGPKSCRIVIRAGAVQSTRTAAVSDWAARRCVSRELRFWKRVLREDFAILPQVQAGVESARHPGPGLISRREERIVHFQRWLLDRMGSDTAGPFIEPMSFNEGVSA